MQQMWPGGDRNRTDCCTRERPALGLLGPQLQLRRARFSLSAFGGCGCSGELGAVKPRPETLHFSMWWAIQLQVFLVEAHGSCCPRFQAFSSLAVAH